nr:hypothetical protein [Tanacetum cinerariifolium]
MMTQKLHLLLNLMQLQISRTWLDTNLDCSLTEIRSYNDHGALPKWKQLKPEFLSVKVRIGYMDNNTVDGHTWRFIKICKESCEDENVVEAYEKMPDFYHCQIKPKKKTKAVNRMISSYQYVGLVNVAVSHLWTTLM